MKLRFLLPAFFGLICVLGKAQMIKAPTNNKPAATETKKKPAVKPVVKFKDEDDEPKAEPAVKPVDNTFTYLIIKANKGSSVNVNINENESGKIRAGMSKKIPLNNSDELRISLNDGQGNQYDTLFIVEDKDAKKNIVVNFPEVDYGAVKAEEMRIKKEQDEAIRLQKEEELRIIREAKAEELRKQKEADEALRLQREEELRKQREADEALRQVRIGLLTETETALKDNLKNYVADKAQVQLLIENVKKGEIKFDAAVTGAYQKFITNKASFTESIKTYSDSATAYNLKDKKDNFLKEIKPDHDKILVDNFSAFITGVQAGKVSSSNNVQIAFKTSRASDIKFFIAKDSLDEPVLAGKRPLAYAIEVKSDTSIFRYLFENGVDPTNFGTRFPENKDVYATPLAYAAMNGDAEVIKLFIASKAQFYPTGLTKKERKDQNKFLLSKFGDKTEVVNVLNAAGYDLDDGTADMLAAIKFLDSTMVLVEGGPFTMGCSEEQASECAADERPAIKVTVNDFYITKFELTQKIWMTFMDDENPSAFKDCPACPVEMVSWKMVQDFIEKLNKASGKKFRLPYEVEFEYAARGGKTMAEVKNFLYAGSSDVTEVGFYKSNAIKTQPIGSKKPNALGLYDMSGNVSEWCNDWYADDYYAHSTLTNPHGPEVGALKVVRGGSFMQDAWGLRVSNREGDNPETYKKNFLGFRLVLDK